MLEFITTLTDEELDAVAAGQLISNVTTTGNFSALNKLVVDSAIDATGAVKKEDVTFEFSQTVKVDAS